MGDALSKPAEPWEDDLPASPPAQQVPPADAAEEQPAPSDRRRVKVGVKGQGSACNVVCWVRPSSRRLPACAQPTIFQRPRARQVSSVRLKPADAGGGPAGAAADSLVAGRPEVQPADTPAIEGHEPAARQGAVAPTAVVGRKRKAVEPADGDGSESKRQQLLGLTILTLGVLQVRTPWIGGRGMSAVAALLRM